MAKYVATTDGNWSTVGTWSTGTNTPSNHASTAVTISTTHYTAKFTAPSTSDDCMGAIFIVQGLATSGADYTYTVTLQENEVDTVAAVALTGDLLDYPGPIFAKFTTPYTFTSTTASYYRFKIVRTGTGTGNMTMRADSGGSLVAFQAVDDRTPAAAPTTGDDVWIVGANGAGTVTVTVNGTCYVGSGTDKSIAYGQTNMAVYIGAGGLLKWDTSASATLTCKGFIYVIGRPSNKGELQIGTVASPYPTGKVAKLRFDNYGTQSQAGIGSYVNGRVQLHGYSSTGTTNWKTHTASGTGSVADPLVMTDAVDWTTGDEILVTTSATANHGNGDLYHQNELCTVTKVDASTYSLVAQREILGGDFEGALASGWTQTAGTGAIAVDTSTFHGGAQSIKLTAGASYNTNVYRSIYTKAGETISLKFWTRGDGTYAGEYQIYRVTATAANIVARKSTGVTSTTWTEVTETFTVPAGCIEVRIYLWCPATNTGVAYFDDVTATIDGLMYDHNAGVYVLHMSRNVIMESTSQIEGFASGVASNIEGDVDYDWIRVNHARGPIAGGYSPSSQVYQSFDYNVVYACYSNNNPAIYWQYHQSYAMAPNTFTGVIVYTQNDIGFRMEQINKTLVDCFAINCSGDGFKATYGSVTMTRCVAITCNRGSGSSMSSYQLAGSAIYLTDCESQSAGYAAIYTVGGTKGRIIRFKSSTQAPSNAMYGFDLIGTALWNDISYEDCIFEYAIPTSQNLASSTSDSEWRISNYNDVDNVDFVVKPQGYRYRTGTALADTTVHTAGGYAVRFQSTISTSNLTWEFDVPTGDIQDKTMMVGVWVMINKEAYWAGTHELPRLTIDYDNGTTSYAEALETASDTVDVSNSGWQFLSVPFTPITTFGQITVTLSTKTDATTTNAYVYFDDFSILYPAGVQLNLGALDLWADANPIVPPIATNLSALDVWGAASTIEYGASTMGETLKDISGGLTTPEHDQLMKLKNASLIIDGEIII